MPAAVAVAVAVAAVAAVAVAPARSNSAGQHGPRSSPFTPLCGGESGTIRPRSGSRQGCRLLFARAGCPIEKPGPGSRTCRAPPGKRQAGWPSLWLLSLGHPRESSSRSARSAKAFALYPPSRARASRTGCAPTKKSKSIAAEAAPTTKSKSITAEAAPTKSKSIAHDRRKSLVDRVRSYKKEQKHRARPKESKAPRASVHPCKCTEAWPGQNVSCARRL